ncbi:transposase [Halochromatium glycolicum]|jgi:hypothetical protein|uniref:Transposase IS801/IS1294 domain-containing protein n=1 Tax=Halochromatium glycolicum TaxID=85075 RepID=A0AAJ0U394_9GAMM|nr:transposase [Halochromatium glycolicum]MBK1704293.1 hypothetical protein [Halochromatium glycolicum]
MACGIRDAYTLLLHHFSKTLGQAAGGHFNQGRPLPAAVTNGYVVRRKRVDYVEKALVYVGRYRYRGVGSESDILACRNGRVIFRYQQAKRQYDEVHTLPGAQCLTQIFSACFEQGRPSSTQI